MFISFVRATTTLSSLGRMEQLFAKLWGRYNHKDKKLFKGRVMRPPWPFRAA